MGRTPGQYTTGLRLARIARALIETDATVAEIAFANGFNNLANFNRRFRQHFGCSPTSYRRSIGDALAAGSRS